MTRVTADSNIYISALNFGGIPDEVITLARTGWIVIAVSEPIMDEVSHVLRDKFQWTEEAIQVARSNILDLAEHVVPTERVSAIDEDPADNRILECALTSASDYLVTGDKAPS
jgi:uncharacterized protein